MLSRQFVEDLWYGNNSYSRLLAPLGWLYATTMVLRRWAYRCGLLPVQRLPIPVIVVGNITVGGTGKTPLIIWLANFLRQNGYHPGIVSRGYGGKAKHYPQQVRPDSDPYMAGDEPVLIAQRTGCPVATSPHRYQAARRLSEHTGCDLILCDDGLQHHALHRDIEIAVVDGDRRFGNGRCLPAGPLREPVGRLQRMDMVVANGHAGKNQYLMTYQPQSPRALHDPTVSCDIDSLAGKSVHVVTGIGNPQRFYDYLRSRRLTLIKHNFPDHHQFRREDLRFDDDFPIFMTEKDAVKCRRFNIPDCWYIPIDAVMTTAFEYRFKKLIDEVING